MTEVLFDDQGRPQPPLGGDEAGTLTGFLDYQRATLEWKTRGLADEQLRVSIDPTSMTLGGLLKHMALRRDTGSGAVARAAEPLNRGREVDWKADKDWEWHKLRPGLRWTNYERSETERSRTGPPAPSPAIGAGRRRRTCPQASRLGRTGRGVSLRWVARPHDRGVREAQRPRRPASAVPSTARPAK